MKNKIFFILLFSFLTGFTAEKTPPSNMTDLFRSTGGDVIIQDKKNLKIYYEKKVDFINEDLYSGPSSLIFTTKGKLQNGIINWNFYIDPTIKKLRISVVGTSIKPDVIISDPEKKEIYGREIFPGENGTKQIFEKPIKGQWSIQIKSDEDIHIVIDGTGVELVSNSEPEIVKLMMGREGPMYIPDKGSEALVPGKNQTLSIEMDFGEHRLSNLELKLISLDGNVLGKKNLGKWDGQETIVDILIPPESFRLMLLGVNTKSGNRIQRMWEKVFLVK